MSHHLITVRPQAIYPRRHYSQYLNRLEIYLQSSSKDSTGYDSESSDHLSAGRVCSSGEWNCGALFGVSRRPEGRKSTLDRGNIYSGVTSSRSDAAGGVGGVSRSDCGAHSWSRLNSCRRWGRCSWISSGGGGLGDNAWGGGRLDSCGWGGGWLSGSLRLRGSAGLSDWLRSRRGCWGRRWRGGRRRWSRYWSGRKSTAGSSGGQGSSVVSPDIEVVRTGTLQALLIVREECIISAWAVASAESDSSSFYRLAYAGTIQWLLCLPHDSWQA